LKGIAEKLGIAIITEKNGNIVKVDNERPNQEVQMAVFAISGREAFIFFNSPFQPNSNIGNNLGVSGNANPLPNNLMGPNSGRPNFANDNGGQGPPNLGGVGVVGGGLGGGGGGLGLGGMNMPPNFDNGLAPPGQIGNIGMMGLN
jgi:hypothetical protein